MRVYADYFVAAMDRLRGDFLNVPLEYVSHPAALSAPARQAAEAQQAAASAAPAVGQKELTAQTWFEKGFNAADPAEKIWYYTEAIRRKPDYAAAYNNRGYARRAKGDLYGALKDYAEAIRLKPDYAKGVSRRATGDPASVRELGLQREAGLCHDLARVHFFPHPGRWRADVNARGDGPCRGDRCA
jgi:tetratricopeptide (TPR) repeat protein